MESKWKPWNEFARIKPIAEPWDRQLETGLGRQRIESRLKTRGRMRPLCVSESERVRDWLVMDSLEWAPKWRRVNDEKQMQIHQKKRKIEKRKQEEMKEIERGMRL